MTWPRPFQGQFVVRRLGFAHPAVARPFYKSGVDDPNDSSAVPPMVKKSPVQVKVWATQTIPYKFNHAKVKKGLKNFFLHMFSWAPLLVMGPGTVYHLYPLSMALLFSDPGWRSPAAETRRSSNRDHDDVHEVIHQEVSSSSNDELQRRKVRTLQAWRSIQRNSSSEGQCKRLPRSPLLPASTDV